MSPRTHSLSEEINAAIRWWRDAGVEYDFSDDATDWLEEPPAPAEDEKPASGSTTAPSAEQKAPPAQPAKNLLGDAPPQTLEDFHAWWPADGALAVAGNAPRLAPRGVANAEVMVLVVAPEAEDRERLLSGPQGRLLEKIFAAMGIEEDASYIASAIPQALDMADGQELVAAGYAQVLAHHIALAAPKRLLVFGANALPLLGHDAAQQPENVEEFSTGSLTIPTMVSEGLDSLIAMPRLKARFWRRWLEWTDGQVSGEA